MAGAAGPAPRAVRPGPRARGSTLTRRAPAATSPTRAAVDEAIDRALARIRGRLTTLGPGAAELGGALTRAAGGGKRFRPALVVAAAEAWGQAASPAVVDVAAAFELLHTAFVVHDDVIDHDTVRRGIPNVAGEFRRRAESEGADAEGAALLAEAAAILAGDLLLHEAERLVALAEADPEVRRRVLDLVDEAVLVTVAGELADVENAVAADWPGSGATLSTAHDKTAVYSFRAPLCAGATLAGAPEADLTALAVIGGRIGLAFQLVDDLIGAFGDDAQAGRAAGGDLREAKRTPLIAFARESHDWPRVQGALSLAHTGPIAVREAQRALADSGARESLRDLVAETLRDARARTERASLPPAAAALLHELAASVEARIP